MTNSLIIGGTGQDGSFLANHLLRFGHNVTITYRPSGRGFENLEYFGIRQDITALPYVLGGSYQLFKYLEKNHQDHIYILAGLSDTHLSFDEPSLFFQENTANLIDLIVNLSSRLPGSKFFIFGSLDEYMFNDALVSEESWFGPVSPYGISRVSTHMFVRYLINREQLNAYYGIFGAHESVLRDKKFFTAKVATCLNRFVKKSEPFFLGDLTSLRDWGCADEYMEMVCNLMSSSAPAGDYFFVTGKLHSCEDYLTTFLSRLGILYTKDVSSNSVRFLNTKTNQLICESKITTYPRNSSSHPRCSNNKLFEVLRRRPMKGINEIIDGYVKHLTMV